MEVEAEVVEALLGALGTLGDGILERQGRLRLRSRLKLRLMLRFGWVAASD